MSVARRTVAVVGALLAVACVVLGLVPAATAAGPAYVRGAHLIPGMPDVQMSLTPVSGAGDEVVLGRDVGYGDTSDYVALDPGSYAVAVRLATSAPDSPPALRLSLRATSGSAYTITGVGTKADPQLAVLDDALDEPAADEARVRVVNGTGDLASIDVTAVDGPTLGTGVERGKASSYADVPVGTWRLEVASDGRSSGSALPVDVEAGHVYSVLVLGDTDDGLRLTPVVDLSDTQEMPAGAPATGLGGLTPSTPRWVALVPAGLLGVVLATMLRRPRPA